MKTIVGLFDTFDEAKRAATDLENAGITHNDISIVANNESGQYATNTTDTTVAGEPHVSGHAIGHDAKVGAEYGGVAGLLLGLTGLAIPGLGWIATAGWLGGMILGAATGAVVGGLVGAFTSVGVPEEDAYNYNEAVRRGGILLAVRAQDDQAQRVAEILGEDGAINIDERVDQYRSEGYVPGAATTATTTTAATMNTTAPAVPTTTQTGNTTDGTAFPIGDESLAVGRGEVQSGARVYGREGEPVYGTTGTTYGTTVGHTARDLAADASGAVQSTEGSIPGIQTGGHAVDGSGAPDTRGIMEKTADAITGDRIDDKTGRPV